MTSVDDAINERVTAALDKALAPLLARLSEPEPLVYTVPQVATALGVSRSTVDRWVRDGVLPVMPYTEGRRLIPRRAVEEFVDAATARKPA